MSHLHTSEGRSHHLGPNEETSALIHIKVVITEGLEDTEVKNEEWGSELKGEGWDFGIASAVWFTVSLPGERNSLLGALLVLVNGVLTKRVM